MSANFPLGLIGADEYDLPPLGPLRAEAFIERTEDIKTYARGYLGDSEGWCVEADGVFIRPAWARDARQPERSDRGILPA